MKNKKPKKNKKKEDKKEDTLTKILILVIFVILVFYVPDLWKTFDIPLTVKRIPWRLSANDNLEANLHALAGEEYLFVKGYLRSSCTRFQEQDHCPFKIIEAKPSIYYEEPLLFYKLSVPIRYRLMNRTAENITLELDDVSFISFVKKGNNKIRFLIQDYITNLGLCRKKGLHVNGTICPINWAKKFRIDNITRKRKDISVEITRFDIEQKNTSAEAHIQGRIKGNLTNPLLEVMVYSHAERNPTRLKKRELI
ncbi:hypothetical protein KY348_07595, partial [Candidatus Woesearchaeota archaeon]|nr:hypothetical protein [Candidatus Woesearchaeota archaeon]